MRNLLMALALLLAGCSVGIDHYQDSQPTLRLEDYFQGRLVARGMFQDYRDRVVKRFVVTIDANWQGDTGTLDEHFVYDDGSTQRRVWTLKALGDGRYSGTAGDVLGVAQGQARGMAFQWAYDLALAMDDGDTLTVGFDDWMYQLDDKHLVNRSTMTKFGVAVGQVTLFFEKQ